ncbi:hypothetical protein, partial [Paenibacillus sp. RC84]|uniref:hypothetical protein n=1 Tax=Paenibacillus sp. RC84 TaxID=3156252 RepID=UPI0035153E25
MEFRFAAILRKHSKPYDLIRKGSGGDYDDDGVWVPGQPERVTLTGVLQPVSAQLMQVEGGRYTEEDRTLYTLYAHEPGDLVTYKGVQYTVVSPQEREYRDVNQ